jgi:hypothetical protein
MKMESKKNSGNRSNSSFPNFWQDPRLWSTRHSKTERTLARVHASNCPNGLNIRRFGVMQHMYVDKAKTGLASITVPQNDEFSWSEQLDP